MGSRVQGESLRGRTFERMNKGLQRGDKRKGLKGNSRRELRAVVMDMDGLRYIPPFFTIGLRYMSICLLRIDCGVGQRVLASAAKLH